MKRLQSILGYIIALLMVPLVMAIFGGEEVWKTKLVQATGLTVTPWFTGGPIERVVPKEGYQIQVHRRVVDGLFRPRRRGFVQVDWRSYEKLPMVVNDPIDLDNDQKIDLWVHGDTRKETVRITVLNPDVLGVREVLKLKDAWAVRINIRNKRGRY